MRGLFGYVMCALIGYLVGCINPAYILSKCRGYDIRTRGSGNAGASNTLLLMGKKRGVFVALFDIMKAYAVCAVFGRVLPLLSAAQAVAGVSGIMGHMFPAPLGFKGGKGLAAFGGVALALNWKLFAVIFAAAAVTAVVTDYIVFAMLVGVTVYPVTFGIITGKWNVVTILILATITMCLKHIQNFKRIRAGLEFKISYLWNKT